MISFSIPTCSIYALLCSYFRTYSRFASDFKIFLIHYQKREEEMISYRPLFETMSKKNISSYALFKMGFPKSTYHSIRKGDSISTNTVNQLCKLLKCSVSEVIEFIDDSE